METNITLNTTLLLLFLLANLVIGLWSSRGIKTFDDYIQRGKNLSGGVLMATMVATLFDASLLDIHTWYKRGGIQFITPLFFSGSVFFVGSLILPKLVAFKKEQTIAEVMGSIYGHTARLFTVIITTIFSLFVIVAQLTALSWVGNMIKVPNKILIGGVGFLITLYTYWGGIRSVVKTDVFQFLVIFIGTFLFFIQAIYPLNVEQIIENIKDKNTYFSFFSNNQFQYKFFIALFWVGFPSFLIAPPIIQRVLMSKKKEQVRNMFGAFAMIYPLLNIMILLVVLNGLSIKNNLAIAEAAPLGDFVIHLCKSHLGQAFFLLAIFSICMSSMDSFLNALAIMWVHDMLPPIDQKKEKNIRIIQNFVAFFGLIGTVAALFLYDKGLWNVLGYGIIIMTSITIPFLLGVAGLKGSKGSFWISIGVFASCIGIPFVLNLMGVESAKNFIYFIREHTFKNKGYFTGDTFNTLRFLWIFALPMTLFAFLLTHLIEHKGHFTLVKRENGHWYPHQSYKLSSFFGWIREPITWCEEKAKTTAMPPFIFSFFTILYSLFPYLTSSNLKDGLIWLGFLRAFPLVLSALLMTKPHWSPRFTPYWGMLYYMTLLYSYPLLTTLTLLCDPTGYALAFYIVTGLLFLGILVPWSTFVGIHLLGIPLGIIVQRLFFPSRGFPSFGHNGGALLFAAIFFPILFIALFVRHKDHLCTTYRSKYHTLLAQYQTMLLTYEDNSHQISDVLHRDGSMMKVLQRMTDQMKMEQYDPKRIEQLRAVTRFFKKMGQRTLDFLYLEVDQFSLNDLLDQSRKALALEGVSPEDIVLSVITKARKMCGDRDYIERLIVGGLCYCAEKYPNAPLYFFLDDAAIAYGFPTKEAEKANPALRLTITTKPQPPLKPRTYHGFIKNSQEQVFNDVRLLENRRIVGAHYGWLAVDEALDYSTQTYVLPIDLKSMRPKIERFAQEDLGHLPLADAAVDRAFLAKIKAKGLNVDRLRLALRIAKHYHKDQKRGSGEPFYHHPLAVATLLLEYTEKESLLVAALLHDTIEDTPYDLDQMTAIFGRDVARIVGDVTHLYGQDERPKMRLEKAATLERLIGAGHRDAMMIKVFDRLHNMQTIEGKIDPSDRKRIAKETLRIFVPMAGRLDLAKIAEKLKKLAQKVLEE